MTTSGNNEFIANCSCIKLYPTQNECADIPSIESRVLKPEFLRLETRVLDLDTESNEKPIYSRSASALKITLIYVPAMNPSTGNELDYRRPSRYVLHRPTSTARKMTTTSWSALRTSCPRSRRSLSHRTYMSARPVSAPGSDSGRS